MSAAGVTVVVDGRGPGLPVVAYWGPELPGLDDEQVSALLRAAVGVTGSNAQDEPPPVAIIPEHKGGWTGRPGLRGSAGGAGWSPSFQITSFRPYGNGGPGLLEVEAADDAGRLALLIEIELLPSGLLRARATLTNQREETYGLEDLVLSFPLPAEATELLDFAGRHNLERVPQRAPLHVGLHTRENRRGRTGADSAYVLHAGEPGFGFARGRVWAVHTAWSGNHTHYAERVWSGEQRLGGGELLLAGEVRLARGEAYRTPWVYGSHGDGLDEVARRFHRHLRSRGRPVDSERPVSLNVWEAVYFDHRLDKLLELAELAAAAGAERYVLDDGWFGSRRDDTSGLGDWVVSPDVWPDGLHPLINGVKRLGLQFGLWFEPEMVNPDSDLAREHPEWIMSARDEWPVESRRQQVLNLGLPGAYEHVKTQILAILDEYAIDYIKWDHNRDLIEAGTQPTGEPGVHDQTLAFYRLLDELRAAHPALEIESCSSGGGRVDLEVLARSDRVWVSDNIDPHDRQHMLRWSAQLVPPEFLGSHIASDRNHVTGRRHDLAFRAGTAVFGHLGIEWDLTAAGDEQLGELGEWIAFFKEHRGLLLGGDLVRMDGYGDDVLVHGVVSPDRSAALIAMVTMASPYPDPPARLRFRGLDPRRPYRLRPLHPASHPPPWWDGDVVLSGAAIEHAGVAAPRVRPDQVVLYSADALRGPDGGNQA
ncbi:alpha-galactosidase [Actinoplanes sp. LDG1-06]|uniref:alpha-galactosidase n=2 Tax=Paractinoplanes ovalisporus TaxID=2810368 RepID=A0ABS2AIT5_9ACTN|nr:alpha-galactosidase [Actinoplanes ovalisporus]